MKEKPKDLEGVVVPDRKKRVCESTELVDGNDAKRYNRACDYSTTSDYVILAEEIQKKFGIANKKIQPREEFNFVGGRKILEIGSGPGNLCEELSKRGAGLVVGLDGAITMIEHASRRHQNNGNVIFVKGSVYKMPFSSEFDLVVCQNSFHQLYKPAEALREMVRVAAPGGIVYIADFRRDVPKARFRERIQYTKPEIRGDLTASVLAALTKQEFRKELAKIPGITFSVTGAKDPRGLSPIVDQSIKNDPVPHFRDYLISQRVEIHKEAYQCQPQIKKVA